MRIPIDECIDVRLGNFLPGRDSQTARFAGLAGLKNGDLLTAAEAAGFDVLLTVDQGLEYQQNLRGGKIAIVVVHAKSNRLKDLQPNIPAALACLETIKPGEIINLG
jgi:predicted nuclease of predicted toxin-antitoxin system